MRPASPSRSDLSDSRDTVGCDTASARVPMFYSSSGYSLVDAVTVSTVDSATDLVTSHSVSNNHRLVSEDDDEDSVSEQNDTTEQTG